MRRALVYEQLAVRCGAASTKAGAGVLRWVVLGATAGLCALHWGGDSSDGTNSAGGGSARRGRLNLAPLAPVTRAAAAATTQRIWLRVAGAVWGRPQL
jgi:hypothetical protein